MRQKSLLTYAIFFFVMFFATVARIPNAAASAVHTVTIEAMKFSPASLTVQKGDTIKWINKDIVPHTATDSKKRFDSSVINGGGDWKYTATVSGKFEYICTLHPLMKATITVR